MRTMTKSSLALHREKGRRSRKYQSAYRYGDLCPRKPQDNRPSIPYQVDQVVVLCICRLKGGSWVL